ncbi:unnamed protein product [Moneuplotes crassus]|uniref:Uncharacterized protein n=1 Tax=Euplotes crassus TaxID=5936 RepID=A0AAD1Y531_EUPCR|nr:unnamed protein product [Moneuplotes crassus]
MGFEVATTKINIAQKNSVDKISKVCQEALALSPDLKSTLILSCGSQFKLDQADFDQNRGMIIGYEIVRHLISLKQALKETSKDSTPISAYLSCYEIIADAEEDIVDLIEYEHSERSSINISKSQSKHSSVKSESEMQEIFIDTDSLEELQMVVNDLFSKRKRVFCGHEDSYDKECDCCKTKKLNMYKEGINQYAPPYISNVVLKIRIAQNDSQDESDPEQKEIYLIDLSEYNEPVPEIQNMLLKLESDISSLSLDTRICQFVFEKCRKVDSLHLLGFINSPKDLTKIPEEVQAYTDKITEFSEIAYKVFSTSNEIFGNFRSRVLDNLSSEIGGLSVFSQQKSDESKLHFSTMSKSISAKSEGSNTHVTKLKAICSDRSLTSSQRLQGVKNCVKSFIKDSEHSNYSIKDDNEATIINKITNNILKELDVANMFNSQQNIQNTSTQDKELCLSQSQSYIFSKVSSEKGRNNRKNRISAIKKRKESKGSSFASNILLHNKNMMDLKESGRKSKKLVPQTSGFDYVQDKENISNKSKNIIRACREARYPLSNKFKRKAQNKSNSREVIISVKKIHQIRAPNQSIASSGRPIKKEINIADDFSITDSEEEKQELVPKRAKNYLSNSKNIEKEGCSSPKDQETIQQVQGILQDSMKLVRHQMNSFLDYFVNGNHKPRSKKRSLIRRCIGSLSCSGSRERKNNYISTPKSQSSSLYSKSYNFSNNPIQKKDDSSSKNSKIHNKVAARRHIVLFPRNSHNSSQRSSERIKTTVTKNTNRRQNPRPARREINLGVIRHPLNSERNNYSIGMSTLNKDTIVRTLDDR